uniref:Reverse transcriptase domain-containing protein n=1 Tax=Chara braunii TaxID=69332 RepID=A0A388JVD5_CHABU
MLAWSTETKRRADDTATAAKKKAEDAEQARLLAIEQQRQHDEATAKAADEEGIQRREKIFNREQTLLTMAAEWRTEAENGKMEDSENKIALLLSHLTDLLATCITQQEDIDSLDDSLAQVHGRLRQLEQRPVAAPDTSSSNTSDRLEALEMDVGSLKDGAQLQQTATQQLEQRICTAANHSSSELCETAPKFDGQEIFCDSTKTDPISWFRKFELTLQLHYVKEHKHHTYLYSRSGGACQAWLDNLLSKSGVVAADLHTKISWDDLKAAWHKRFHVEPLEIKAMDKLMVFEQGTLPSVDWIAEYQRLTSVPDIQMGFKNIRHYFISRSCPALSNALTHVEDTVTTTTKLFDKAAQIIITNKEAKNLRPSAPGPSRDQHRPRVAVVAATTPFDQTCSEAVSANEGDSLAAAREVVTAKSFRATCVYEQPEEIGLCFLRTVPVADSSPTDLSSDPRVVRLLDEFADIFESPTGVVPDRPISHEIILEAGAVPPKGCIYRMSEEELEVLRAQLDDLLAKGWIRPSSSPYGAPVLFVRKKNKDLRLCIDYRKLNAQTVKNAGPLPRIDDLLERLGGAKYFSKLDLKSGYHQISIWPNDCYKSAFKTWYRHFEWVVMPFGLTNAPTTFQAAMTNEFRAMLDRFVLVYLDDILVYSRTLEDHLGHLRRVLETLRRAKYRANRDKCEFVRQELEYLGHFVTPEGISPLSDKIQAIQEWSEPRNVTDVRSFLGLACYYQRFMKGYSKIATHLTKLQCEDRPFDFGEEARESFLALKAALLSAEVLRIYDPLLPTRVTTDASGYGIGAVLKQHDGVDWHPVEYFSKKVPIVHSIDDARNKELLAFVHTLKWWRHFLLGRSQFRWVTHNNPLVFYKTQDTVNNTIARWMAFIDQFDFFPDHIPGKSNRFADALSRRPDHCTAVYSTFEIDDDLRNSFIRGYQVDPEFRDKYANRSSPNPAPSHYRIQEGYLLVHTRGKGLLCVPSDPHLRTRLLGEFHDAPATGNFGVNRTIGRLRERFWWPGLLGDVTRYCESCKVCRRCKSRNHRSYGELRPLPIPLRRREAIAMDITGPFPKHKTGMDGILIVVDRLTKFAMFLPFRNHAKAPELAEFNSPPPDRWPKGEGAPDRTGSPSHSHPS